MLPIHQYHYFYCLLFDAFKHASSLLFLCYNDFTVLVFVVFVPVKNVITQCELIQAMCPVRIYPVSGRPAPRRPASGCSVAIPPAAVLAWPSCPRPSRTWPRSTRVVTVPFVPSAALPSGASTAVLSVSSRLQLSHPRLSGTRPSCTAVPNAVLPSAKRWPLG